MHQLPDVVHVYLNMFGPLPSNGIYGDLNSSLTVSKYDCGKSTTNIKLWKNALQPNILDEAFTASLYLTSAEESAMAAYFLLDQKMGPPPKINTYPEVGFRYMESPTQSESVKPTICSSESAA